jgi:cell division protein ZapA
MANKAVELHVAGQSCRVVSSADEKELKILAAMVEEKLKSVLTPGRPLTTQAVLLAAVALANDVREQRARAETISARAQTALRTLLTRVDGALEQTEAASSPHAPDRHPEPLRQRPVPSDEGNRPTRRRS